MKKILTLLAVVGAATGAVAVMAKRRGQDIGEFAGEWAERAKEVASPTTDALTDTLKDTSETIEDEAVDLRDELPLGDRP